MSDRHYSLTVTLDGVYNEDATEHIQEAIKMIKGVSQVTAQVADAETYFAIDQARRELGQKILGVIYPKE